MIPGSGVCLLHKCRHVPGCHICLTCNGRRSSTTVQISSGIARRLHGYSCRSAVHSPTAVNPFHDDPGFYCHILFVSQYTAPIFRSKCDSCGGGGVWVAGGSPFHWGRPSWPDCFTI